MSDEKQYPTLEYISSCTIDDAVAKMLGWLQGPVYEENIKLTKDGNVRVEDLLFVRTLPNTIEEQFTYLIGVANKELAEAENQQAPSNVIEEKTNILKNRFREMELAGEYKASIDDELFKGDSSALRIDVESSTTHGVKYISIRSLHDWAIEKYGINILGSSTPTTSGNNQSISSKQPSVSNEAEQKPVKEPKFKLQEKAILEEIQNLGYAPRELPKNQAGKRGIKSEIRAALEKNPLFNGRTTFNKVWQALRDCKKIENNNS